MAIIAGSFFSVNFDPVTYLEQNCDNPQDGEEFAGDVCVSNPSYPAGSRGTLPSADRRLPRTRPLSKDRAR